MLRLCLIVALALLSSHVAAAERLKIVATFSVLADIGREIAGEHAEIHALMGADADPHLFQPSPSALQRLRRADLVISNGLGFERWLPGLLKSVDYRAAHCLASRGVTTLAITPDHDHEQPANGDDAGQLVDPHAWLSPARAQQYVDNISRALAAADPAHAADYRARATSYRARLRALDETFRGQLAGVPVTQRKLMVDHNAFRYLGDDYNIEFIAARERGEPSARDLARLIRLARQSGVRALLAENIADQRLLAQIAREAKLSIAGELYSDALASDGPSRSYLGMMRHNLQLLGRVLAN